MNLDKQGFIDLSELEKKNYTKILLTHNPFPSTAVPADMPLATADRQAAIRRFKEVLSVLYSDRSSSVTVLMGDYGVGKSHLLKLFKGSVNKRLMTGDKPIIAIYVKSPGKTFRDLYLYLIDDMTKGFLTTLAQNWMFRVLSKSDYSKFLKGNQSYVLSNVNKIPEFLENSRVIDVVNRLSKELMGVGNSDLVRSFLFLPHPDFGSIAWRWFVGSSLSRDERETLGIETPIEDPHIAEEVMNAFLKLLIAIGISGTVVLIDELEALTLIPGMGKNLYQDSLRHLIDSNPTGLVLFAAITGQAWTKLTETPSALERRLASSVFDLSPFRKEDVFELVVNYLITARSDDFGLKVKDVKAGGEITEQHLYPFSIEGVEEIFAVTKGIVHKIVALCRLCVDASADECTVINSTFVQKVITEEGFR